MAEELDDGEFWLPPEFLDDDFFLEEKNGKGGTGDDDGDGDGGGGGDLCFPTEFPYGCGYGSNSSSPGESVTETESDEEDYMAGLSRQMARSFLQDDNKEASALAAADSPKAAVTVGSPQSTLFAVGSWNGSSRESSNGPSQVSSPPSTPLAQGKDDAWDLLYAAAGQVVRMRLDDENGNPQGVPHGRGLLGPPRKASPPLSAAAAAATKPASTGYYVNPSLLQHQLQVNQFQQLKQQQLMKQQCSAAWGRQNRARGGNTRSVRPLGLSSSAWPPLQSHQPQAGSGMRAVFLAGSCARKESCGTGVFLPRSVGNPTELRKKPACSTVLLPARVVQALNLNVDELGAQPRFPGGFVLDHDAIVARSNAMRSQKRNYRPQTPSRPHHQHEVRLPPEWTY